MSVGLYLLKICLRGIWVFVEVVVSFDLVFWGLFLLLVCLCVMIAV